MFHKVSQKTFIMLLYYSLPLLVFTLLLKNDSFASKLPENFSTEAFWYDGKWAHEYSDFFPDPNVHFGRLKNDFRYAIIPNDQPTGRVSLYLNVQVGSLFENDKQYGFAHYVEHMAFNGSKNFPAGSLIPFFQKKGMSFGGDTNAHTSFSETVYKLNLAHNDKESINSALTILRNFADGVLFEEKEVQKEMGVIMAEKKARESESMVNRIKLQKLLYADTNFINFPIGTEETILSATSKNLSEFYNSWYTPDRMGLIIVGSVDATQVEAMLASTFSSMEKQEKRTPVSPWGNPKDQGLRIFSEKRTLNTVELSLILHFPRVHSRDSRQTQMDALIDSIIGYSLQHRLQQKSQDDATLWTSVRAQNRWRKGFLPIATLSASTSQDSWQAVLALFAEETRRMSQYGLTKQELDDSLEYIKRNIQRYIDQRPSMTNDKIADIFLTNMNADRVYTSLDFDKEMIGELSKEINLFLINKTVRHIYTNKNISIILGSSNPPDVKMVRSLWEKAQTTKIIPYVPNRQAVFPYLETPPKVDIKNLAQPEKKSIAEVDGEALYLYKAKLSGGIELYILPLPFSKDTIKIQLLFGEGYRALSEEEIALAQSSTIVLKNSGLGKLGRSDTRKITEEIGGSILENYDLNMSSISIEGDASEFERLIQAVWTQYEDPTPTEQALVRAKLIVNKQEHKNNTTVEGMADAQGATFFYGNARRYKSLSFEEIEGLQLKDIAMLIKKTKQSWPVKIFISGDIDVQKAYELAAQYFGHIKIKKGSVKKESVSLVFPASIQKSMTVAEDIDQAVLKAAWRCDLVNQEDRKLMATRQLAATLLRDKLRKDLREGMGAAYSPFIVYRSIPQEKGFGLLQVSVKTDRAQLEQVTQYIRGMKAWVVSQGELDRLRAPIITAWKTNRKKSSMWQRLMTSELTLGMPFVRWNNEYLNTLTAITPDEASKALEDLLSSPYAEWRLSSIGSTF